ncbi:hypothetical protein EIN_084910 [Entamoeba invadens IP1]|uniref:hypothetical protein n=1 Tax=Entamoeba invadens IP1 TaxID=370355 RepID=UPI0002C3E375|nr:hypothetical protein EIN_084910 [Entamoeba invadens IP1]ELP85279.1 hypothetical protein EIN_084910 [Entamoeba invadens IP1]|eukprot:XP_004184625.1 hypothetical protein EIN_084910 [Entamoeba invadens IP1]
MIIEGTLVVSIITIVVLCVLYKISSDAEKDSDAPESNNVASQEETQKDVEQQNQNQETEEIQTVDISSLVKDKTKQFEDKIAALEKSHTTQPLVKEQAPQQEKHNTTNKENCTTNEYVKKEETCFEKQMVTPKNEKKDIVPKIEAPKEVKPKESIHVKTVFEEKEERNKLNCVSLSNLIVYLDNYKTAAKLFLVNKKCQHSRELVKTSPHYKAPSIDLSFPRSIFFEQEALLEELYLFPKMEVFEIYNDPSELRAVLGKSKSINFAVKTFLCSKDIMGLEKEDKARFVEIYYKSKTPERITLFKNLKTATLGIEKDQKVTKFVLKKHQMDVLNIVFFDGLDVTFLEKSGEYKAKNINIVCVKEEDVKKAIEIRKTLGLKYVVVLASSQNVNQSPNEFIVIAKKYQTEKKIIEPLKFIGIPLNNLERWNGEHHVIFENQKIDENFNLKGKDGILQVEFKNCEIDTAVDVNDFYPPSILSLISGIEFVPTHCDNLKKVTLRNCHDPINLEHLSQLQELCIEDSSFGEIKQPLTLPRRCSVLTLIRISQVRLDLENCKNVFEIVIQEMDKIEIRVPHYISNLIIYNSKNVAMTKLDEIDLKRLALIGSQLIFFDFFKVVDKLDVLIMK